MKLAGAGALYALPASIIMNMARNGVISSVEASAQLEQLEKEKSKIQLNHARHGVAQLE